VLERLPISRSALSLPAISSSVAGSAESEGRLFEIVPLNEAAGSPLRGPLRVEYTFDAELTREVFRVPKRGRVELGHVIVMNPTTGRLLAYASTDVARFPPTRTYPAASLVKIITAAAALDSDPNTARLPCRFRGSPYRLTPSRVDPPKQGRTVSLRGALATSNNQCFAQLAVHAVGANGLLDAISRFGWLAAPAPAHPAGSADPGEDRFGVGKLGCGLDGCRITPLHAVQLAATLARGELIAPRWIDRVVDAGGRELPIPAVAAPRRVLAPGLADELRTMLVETTKSGTARRAFRKRGGRPLLGPVAVAAKTGSLRAGDVHKRYEWFIAVAPAESPRIAIAVLLLQSDLWWRNASQIGGEVLRRVFCREGSCRAEAAARWVRTRAPGLHPVAEATEPATTARRARLRRSRAPRIEGG
jgi:cell division protein FtsI/penicillin-binding protein 2